MHELDKILERNTSSNLVRLEKMSFPKLVDRIQHRLLGQAHLSRPGIERTGAALVYDTGQGEPELSR